MITIDEKYETLKARLKEMGKVCIAFSGGVDSTLLLSTASQVVPTLAVTASGAMRATEEERFSEAFPETLDLDFVKIEVDPLKIKDFLENTPERCYYCKKEIFTKIKEVARSKGYSYVLDGTNVDDLDDYRPGIRALKELDVKSPLLEAGLTKSDIYYLSKKFDLPTKNKSAAACLASRIPTGEKISEEKLRRIDKAEALLSTFGFHDLRVRLSEGRDAVLECTIDDFKLYEENSQKIKELLAGLGMELEDEPREYKRGGMNRIVDD